MSACSNYDGDLLMKSSAYAEVLVDRRREACYELLIMDILTDVLLGLTYAAINCIWPQN